uniref:Uncharacterized protein LOC104218435 n=1 Tax=Nicotiana sylvestris TaxID=4096 RepID=A0A1U7VLJ6_NICSY|nr:PREDICTED: uncharacterized protein LOC104218435 [Nicotiana sylvestris]
MGLSTSAQGGGKIAKNEHLREFLSYQAKSNYGRNKDNTKPSKLGEDPPYFKIKRILVDLGSLVNIIQWRVLEQAKPTKSIILATELIVGFSLVSVMTRREILLPTNAEEVMKPTLFEVVDGDMSYNIILGRPWVHDMKVLPSICHQLLKFPTPKGIKQIRGDQSAAREMKAISVSSSKGKEHAT